MYKMRTVFKNDRIWYEIYDIEDKKIIVSTKSYKRGLLLKEMLNNKQIKAESFVEVLI